VVLVATQVARALEVLHRVGARQVGGIVELGDGSGLFGRRWGHGPGLSQMRRTTGSDATRRACAAATTRARNVATIEPQIDGAESVV